MVLIVQSLVLKFFLIVELHVVKVLRFELLILVNVSILLLDELQLRELFVVLVLFDAFQALSLIIDKISMTFCSISWTR